MKCAVQTFFVFIFFTDHTHLISSYVLGKPLSLSAVNSCHLLQGWDEITCPAPLSILCFETRFLSESGAHCLLCDLPVSDIPGLGLCMMVATPSFYMGDEHLNSSLHACISSMLPIAPSLEAA